MDDAKKQDGSSNLCLQKMANDDTGVKLSLSGISSNLCIWISHVDTEGKEEDSMSNKGDFDDHLRLPKSEVQRDATSLSANSPSSAL